MTFIPFFFQISKNFGFYKGFPNFFFLEIFGVKNWKFENFEKAILYSLSFYIYNLFFGEFLNIESILVKIDVKWPYKNVDFSKFFLPISTKLGHSTSNLCRIKYIKFCGDICIGFEVILENQEGADSVPPSGARVKGSCSPSQHVILSEIAVL